MSINPTVPPDGTPGLNLDRLRRALATGGDDTNPEFLFSTTHTALLLAIEAGLADPVKLARAELASRGQDANGDWCGFERAREIHLGAPAADSVGREADTAAQLAITEVALKILRLDTLEPRNSDALDFHQLAVWTISDALTAAYDAGVRAAGVSAKRQEG